VKKLTSLFAALILALPLAAQTKEIALTFDDLPYSGIGPKLTDVYEARHNIRSILDTLKAHHAPAVGFVNEQELQVPDQMDMRVGLLEQWLDGGVELGNHTYSHVNIAKVPEWQAEDEVIKGEVITQRLMKAKGLQERYFRHPFLVTGATLDQRHQFEAFLHSREYTVAPVTLDDLDWAYNGAYRQALKDDDQATAHKLLADFMTQVEANLTYDEKVTHALFGRDIPFVVLMHSNQLNGIMLDQVLSLYERHGYKFITVGDALKDPAYSTSNTFAGPNGSSWEQQWAFSMGKQDALQGAPPSPKYMWDLYNKSNGQ
jgi:peptidoglycan/xylan/chitin deacetylase (PgdA/CDA1 family)